MTLEATNDYLQEEVRPRLCASTLIWFQPVIFEAGEAFEVEVLLIHSNDDRPTTTPYGKIAGIREIPVLRTSLESEDKGLFERVTAGSLQVQVLRSLIYALAFFVTLLIVAGLIAALATPIGAWRRHLRKTEVNALVERGFAQHFEEHFSAYARLYVSAGEGALIQLKRILSGEKSTLSQQYALFFDTVVLTDLSNTAWRASPRHFPPLDESILRVLKELQDLQAIEVDESHIAVTSPTAVQQLEAIMQALDIGMNGEQQPQKVFSHLH